MRRERGWVGQNRERTRKEVAACRHACGWKAAASTSTRVGYRQRDYRYRQERGEDLVQRRLGENTAFSWPDKLIALDGRHFRVVPSEHPLDTARFVPPLLGPFRRWRDRIGQ
jgi:hypothetical protein